MKKILPYIMVIILLSGLGVFIFKSREKTPIKIITISTLHSYMYDFDQLIEIPIYVSDNVSALNKKDAYDSFAVYNDNNLLAINLVEISSGHAETYLTDVYTKLVLKFEIPNLSENYYILDAYLNITMTDGTELDLKIGDFYLNFINHSYDLNWQAIDSKKDLENDTRLQMDYIVINLEEVIKPIYSIKIDSLNDLDYEIINNELLITIPNLKLLINYIPLWLTYDDGTNSVFNNHHFIIEYSALEKAGNLLNIYVLS